MAAGLKHEEMEGLRIDKSLRDGGGALAVRRVRIVAAVIALMMLCAVAPLAFHALAPKSAEVEVVAAKAESIAGAADTVLSARGYIVPHHRISVNSKVTGRVAWIGVEKGDTVKEGQVLVRLEDQEFRGQLEQARGQLESARARDLQDEHGSRPEEVAQANYNLSEAKVTAGNDKTVMDRTRALYEQQIVSRQSFDEATAKYQASEFRVNALEQLLKLARLGPRIEELQRAKGDLQQAEGQVQYAASQLDATIIRAPISGTILERTAEKGELVTAEFASAAEGGPRGSVVALADLRDLQVELDIAQDDFARLAGGQQAIVTLDAFKDRVYRGQITEISPEANRQKASVQVKVKLLDPDNYLRPEMNALVQFTSSQDGARGLHKETAAVLVPPAALRDKSGVKVVYIALDGKALQRSVHVIGQRPEGTLVDSLVGGDTVITAGPVDLKDGQRVHVKGQP